MTPTHAAALNRSYDMKAKEISELLDQARHAIDGGVDCRTPEYTALDLLERALKGLLEYTLVSTEE